MRKWLAFLICPELKDELEALRSGNTKVVLGNGRLMDEIARVQAQAWKYLQEVGIQATRADDAVSQRS